MLVLSRKTQESIIIGSEIKITILSVHGKKVRIGIEAPRNVRVSRSDDSECGVFFTRKIDSELDSRIDSPSLK